MSLNENQLEYFEVIENHSRFSPVGEVTLAEAVQAVSQAIAYARENQIPRLLIDITQLTGFPSPSLADRYFFIREWASQALGCVRVSMVVREEMIEPEKFGVTVAYNLGFIADVFPSEAEAIGWLLNEGK